MVSDKDPTHMRNSVIPGGLPLRGFSKSVLNVIIAHCLIALTFAPLA